MSVDANTVATFTNTANWQGVDDEPTAESDNLVKSGSVKKAVDNIALSVYGDVLLKSNECSRRNNVIYNTVYHRFDSNLNNDVLTVNVDGVAKVSFLGCIYPNSSAFIQAGYYFFDNTDNPISGAAWMKTASGEEVEYVNITKSVPSNAVTLKITVRHEADDDFYCNLIGTNSIPTNLAFPAIFTSEYFNADNENRVINIPNFYVWIHGVQYNITAQNLAYPATSTGRYWHALMLNESYDNVEIKTWLNVDSLSQSRLLAFINIYWRSETEPEVTIFRGSGDIWRVDGKNYNTDEIPQKGSMNPVASNGIYKAINVAGKTVLKAVDAEKIENSFVDAVNSGIISSNSNNDVFVVNVSTASIVKFLSLIYKNLVNSGYYFYNENGEPISGNKFDRNISQTPSITLCENTVNVPDNASILKITVRKEYESYFYCELANKYSNTVAESLSIQSVLSGGIEKMYGSIRTKSDAVLSIRHMVLYNVPDANGNRYSLVFPISKNTIIKGQCSWGKGLGLSIYSDKYQTLLGEHAVQHITNGYSKDEIIGVANSDGYLRAAFAKDNDSAISDNEIEALIDALSLELINYGEMGRLDPNPMSYLAVFTNGYFDADNTARKIHVPEFRVWVNGRSYLINSTDIDYLTTTDRLWHALALTEDCTSVEIVKWPDLNASRTLAFIRSEYTSQVNMNKITIFVGSGGAQFWKIDGVSNTGKSNSIIDKNQDKIPLLRGASNKGTRLTAMIITDVHTDWKQMMNAVDFANKCEYIDCVFFLGDYPELIPSQTAYDNVNLAYEACTKPFFGVIGNHDIRYGKYIYNHASIDVPTEALIEPVFQNLNIGEYATGVPYYYHDFANRNIRVIFLCDFDMPLTYQSSEYWEAVEYDSSAPTWNSSTIYEVDNVVNFRLYKTNSFRCKVQNSNKPLALVVSDGGFRTMTETQWNWIVSTLLSTPAGYKVVIASHIPASCGYDTHERNHKFCANRISESLIMNPLNDDYLGILAKAFNDSASGTLNISYKNVQGAGQTWYFNSLPPCTINYDFSGKNTGAEFMCFISGHTHIDFISKNSYGLYIITSKFCDHIVRQFDYNDVPTSSDDNDIARDALTVISFDTINNAAILTRIGTTATTDGYLRDTEGIDLTQ